MNTTNGKLDLSQGGVASTLLQAGGSSLQQECYKKAPINVGDVAVTGPGNLPCRYVFHTVMPSYQHQQKQAEEV